MESDANHFVNRFKSTNNFKGPCYRPKADFHNVNNNV